MIIKQPIIFSFFLFSSIPFLLFNCKNKPTEPPPPPAVHVTLTVSDIGLTEVSLTIGFVGGGQFIISRDSRIVLRGRFSGNDTTLTDDGLSASRTYTYIGLKIENGITVGSSSPLQVHTLDSTSHNFGWQTFKLGDGSSSALRDVAIVNDTVYAVGEIYKIIDSTNQFDPLPYNFAKWEGHQWILQKVPYYYQGQSFYHPIQSIFAFNANDIWFCGNGLIHWDGNSYNPIDVPSSVWGHYRMNKIWGINNTDLYIVGDSGSIARYKSGLWHKLESGTMLQIDDIYGGFNSKTNTTEIFAIASNRLALPSGMTVLKIDGDIVTSLTDEGLPVALTSLWFIPGKKYYIVGDGMFKKNSIESEEPWQNFQQGITQYYLEEIRGSAENDIMVVGDYGEVLHFNGSTWESFFYKTKLTFGNYYAVAISDNLVAAVGISESKATVSVGRR